MVKRHAFVLDSDGGRTVSASRALTDGAWLPLLEEQLRLIGFGGLSFPVCCQYSLGTALVFSRYEPLPGGGVARQLIFDDPDDARRFHAVRPAFCPPDRSADAGADLPVSALTPEADPGDYFETLDRLFSGNEALLLQTIGAATLCARDKRLSLRVALSGDPAQISEDGRRLMELILACLTPEDALRLSYCTYLRPGDAGTPFSVAFCADDEERRVCSPGEIVLLPEKQSIFLPFDVSLPDDAREREAARALTAHDLPRARHAGNLRRGGERTHVESENFRAGMSLAAYFADWRQSLERRRPTLTDEGFRTLAEAEWAGFLNSVVAASELMDNETFLRELNDVLTTVRKERLSPNDETTTDLIVLLLDSIQWRRLDLTWPQTGRLLRTITAYSQLLNEAQCDPGCLAACRVAYRLLTSPAFVQDSLNDMAFLSETSPALFDALQDCLGRYVQDRMTADVDVIDEAFAAAAMLGFARFSDGVPDLRLADKLTEHLESQLGSRASKRFLRMTDKLRRNLRSKHSGSFRKQDLKPLIFISCLLILLIAGITIGFLAVHWEVVFR